MSAMTVDCLACGGEAKSVAGEGTAMIRFACGECGREFAGLIVPAPEPGCAPAAYRAIVDVPSSPVQASKLRMRLGRALAKVPGFYLSDLERQAATGLNAWDLGRYYAGSEGYDGSRDLAERAAAQVGVELRFGPEE